MVFILNRSSNKMTVISITICYFFFYNFFVQYIIFTFSLFSILEILIYLVKIMFTPNTVHHVLLWAVITIQVVLM